MVMSMARGVATMSTWQRDIKIEAWTENAVLLAVVDHLVAVGGNLVAIRGHLLGLAPIWCPFAPTGAIRCSDGRDLMSICSDLAMRSSD
jgi:hypothetical protein